MEDDIRKYRIVGVPQPLGHSSNALFEVIGYIHSNGTYVPLTARGAEQVFAPKGEVFAYDFYQKYSEFEGKAISFSVIEKKKSYTEGTYTNFVWDFSKDTKPFGYEAFKFPANSITEDPESNNKFINANFNSNSTHYAICGNYLYRFTKENYDRGVFERWNMTREDFRRDNIGYIIYIGSKKCIILSDPIGKPDLIDKMSNLVLMYWFLDHILPTNYPDLAPLIKAIPRDDLLKAAKVSHGIQRIQNERIRRAIDLLDTIQLTKKQVDALSNNPVFERLIKDSIAQYSDEYIKKEKEKYSSDIEKLHHEYEAKKKELVDDLEVELKKKKIQISSETSKLSKNKENLEKDIDALEKQKEQLTAESETLSDNYEKEIKRIEGLKEQKGKILNDFQVVKDVISLLSTPSNVKNDIPNNDIKPTAVNIETWETEGDELQDYEDFDDNIKAVVNGFGFSASSSTLTSLLAKYKIVLLPDARLAYSIAKATGKCYVATSYVGIDWQSFNDLWNNGLSAMVNSCSAHDDVMHYFILQNINLSYLPSYIQPLLDVADGYLSYFPGSELTFPKNLRILCVACDDKGIPMNESCLKRMGCYPKGKIKEKNEIEEMPSDMEYLTPDLLNNADIIDVDNSYQSYIEDDED